MANYTIHNRKVLTKRPRISIILLDWSVREHFQALTWLNQQNAPRDLFELIWLELHERVAPEAVQMADVVITCGQKKTYNKHEAYNIGILEARGEIVIICDSDAVFTPDFIDSVLDRFEMRDGREPKPLILMHHEWRTSALYPEGKLQNTEQLKDYKWWDLWPNVGACMSVRKKDLITFGGFDEHPIYRGYVCGPYDVAWRLVNAGIPEMWEDPKIALWHFSHPVPFGTRTSLSLKLYREIRGPHIDGHAVVACEAFSTGRILPLRENPEIHRQRMFNRTLGSAFEERYSKMTGIEGFSRWQKLKFSVALYTFPIRHLSSLYFKDFRSFLIFLPKFIITSPWRLYRSVKGRGYLLALRRRLAGA